jgi:hypothetical protein
MPEPIPTPTAAEIESVVDITMLSTAAVTAMIAAYDQDIADAKWAATLEDIALWPDIRDEAGDIKKVGSIEFFEASSWNTRLGFRNRIRARYGQALLLSEKGNTCSTSGSYAVTVTADW